MVFFLGRFNHKEEKQIEVSFYIFTAENSGFYILLEKTLILNYIHVLPKLTF